VSKFTSAEKLIVKNIVADLSIKKISDNEIIEEIYERTGKKVSRITIGNIRRKIKRDSFDWFQQLKQGRFEYIHEFKERVNEIMWLMKRHHDIVDKYATKPQIQQKSLEELHRLNITLSNYLDIAPYIATSKRDNDNPISISQKDTIIV